MWSQSPLVFSELIWVGIMMIPLVIFSLRYAHARNKLAQMYAYAQAPTTQHFNSFTSFFPKEDEELNKEWDEKLKDAPRWQEVLGIFQNPNDYKKLVHEAMVWKEKNWSSLRERKGRFSTSGKPRRLPKPIREKWVWRKRNRS